MNFFMEKEKKKKQSKKRGRKDRLQSMVEDFQSRWKGHQGMKMEKEKEIFPQRSKGGKPRSSRCPDVFTAFLPGLSLLGTFSADDPSSEHMGTRTLPGGSS